MREGQVLEFSHVSKRFGGVPAVSDLSARIEPGTVTGFLGPNGAGKTTTLRMLLGLVRPTAGTATIGGVAYGRLRNPVQTVGAVLEASSFHPGRSAANHLKALAHAAALPTTRIDAVLELVGLSDAAGRRVGGFSLGMRQRLGLAAAMLGDPGVLVLDEPVNGLDPEGITWMRQLLQALAAEGRTVLMSSHLLAEVAQTVDRLLIIASGRLVFEGAIEDLADRTEYATVVDAPDRAALETALRDERIAYDVLRGGLTARGAEPEDIGALAAARGIALSTLQRRGPSLEDVFFALVDGAPGPYAQATAAVTDGAVAADAATDDAVTGQTATNKGTATDETAAHTTRTTDPDTPDRPTTGADTTGPGTGPGASSPPSRSPGTVAEHRPGEPNTVTVATTATLIDHGGHAAFAVASTGVIDIVPPGSEVDGEVVAGEPDAPPAGDSLGARRTVPSVDFSRPAAGATEADREADEFFRSFDCDGGRSRDVDASGEAGRPASGVDETRRA